MRLRVPYAGKHLVEVIAALEAHLPTANVQSERGSRSGSPGAAWHMTAAKSEDSCHVEADQTIDR